MRAEELVRRLRAQGVAQVKGMVDPSPEGQEAVWFFGPEGEALQDFYDEEVEGALLEATARWAKGLVAFVLYLEEPPRVEAEVLDEEYEVLRRGTVSLEEFLGEESRALS